MSVGVRLLSVPVRVLFKVVLRSTFFLSVSAVSAMFPKRMLSWLFGPTMTNTTNAATNAATVGARTNTTPFVK